MLGRLQKKWDRVRVGAHARSVLDDRLSYLSIAKFRRINAALAELNRVPVPGDFVEFGVALGGSAIVIAKAAAGRSFHGFDVFAMIPPPTSEKDGPKSKQRYETIASGASKGIGGEQYYGYRADLLEDVRAAFARHGVPVDGKAIALHKGLFEDTWPKAGVQKVAFVHIDCDWYDPVKYCLHAIAHVLSPGGLVVIDDYHAYEGCRTAVDEFIASRSDFRFEPGPNPILRKLR